MSFSRPLKLMVAALCLITFALGGQPTALAQPSFPPYIIIEVAANIAMPFYSGPSSGSTPLGIIPAGARLLWGGERTVAEDRAWMFVDYLGVTGWITPEDEQLNTYQYPFFSAGVEISAQVRVGEPTTVFVGPTVSSNPLVFLEADAVVEILAGPFDAEFNQWWQVSTANGMQGWVADRGFNLVADKPLVVYGYTVCSGFNISKYGVTGWDSIIEQLPTLVPATETIACLASSNLTGDTVTPVVTVLSQVADPSGLSQPLRSILRVFLLEKAGTWKRIYEGQTADYTRTDQLYLYDFVGNGKPMLVWNNRIDGTGSIIEINILNYDAEAQQLVDVINEPGQPVISFYKGGMQARGKLIVMLEADYLPDEPNCCASGLRTVVYELSEVAGAPAFLNILDQRMPRPSAIQYRKGS
jgi:hypothetical protein